MAQNAPSPWGPLIFLKTFLFPKIQFFGSYCKTILAMRNGLLSFTCCTWFRWQLAWANPTNGLTGTK